MLRVSSQRFHANIIIEILALLFLTGVAGYSQSLGDVARENREKKAAETSTTPPKVITNADLPKNPDGSTGAIEENNTPATPSPADTAASRKAAEQRADYQRAADHWKQQILAQKNMTARQQARVDKVRASIHFVDPNYNCDTTYCYHAGVAYNSRQAQRMERLKQMEQQLDQQKQKLQEMQEAARHAGMHTAVYDP
jgi:type IV secretory pathway VirB10-like protein